MNKYYQSYLKFFVLSVILVLVLQTFLAWPYGLVFALGYFVVFPLLFKKIKPKLDHFGNNTSHDEVKYQCLVCSLEYGTRSCPRCGSTIKKIVV